MWWVELLNSFAAILDSGGAGGAGAGAFESIATLSGSGVSTVTFSSIPSTYKHLQVRMFGQAAGGSGGVVRMRFNGDTGTNYTAHYLTGYGSTVEA